MVGPVPIVGGENSAMVLFNLDFSEAANRVIDYFKNGKSKKGK
jgi:hypothetical protein